MKTLVEKCHKSIARSKMVFNQLVLPSPCCGPMPRPMNDFSQGQPHDLLWMAQAPAPPSPTLIFFLRVTRTSFSLFFSSSSSAVLPNAAFLCYKQISLVLFGTEIIDLSIDHLKKHMRNSEYSSNQPSSISVLHADGIGLSARTWRDLTSANRHQKSRAR